MPKVTSAHARKANEEEKENNAPTMAAYLRRRKQSDEAADEDDRDGIVNLKRSSQRAAKERGGSSSSATQYANGGKRTDRRDRAYDEHTSAVDNGKRTRKEAGYGGTTANGGGSNELEDVILPLRSRKKEDVLRELEEVQAQFDELRELRMTEPERMLAEWRSTVEHKGKLAEEYIASLKKQVEEMSTKSARPMYTSSTHDVVGDRGSAYALRRQVDESLRREEKLREENARLAREIEKNRLQVGSSTSSHAFRAGIGSGQMLGTEDERAVRRLYEDLTGLVINKVEHVENDRQDARRFHAIFACAGYHDLEIKLDESTSDLPSIIPGRDSGPREDLVYTPTLDEDRDAELLQSGRLPPFLKDSIRFERATAVKFLSTLHKRLDRHSKR